MTRLTRSGFLHSQDAVPALRSEFLTEHCLCLPNLIDAEFGAFLRAKLDKAQFTARHYDTVGNEFRMIPNLVSGTLQFILNDETIFSWVRQVTGCSPIGCFQGRVYKMLPGAGHSFHWHDDCRHNLNRLITLSINLSPAPYDGGNLEIRRADSHKVVFRAPRLSWGDALMFPISPEFEHRVTPVQSGAPKIAFAGWFLSEPVFSAVLSDRDSVAAMFV